jgi:hypothetical protein
MEVVKPPSQWSESGNPVVDVKVATLGIYGEYGILPQHNN